jgi:hypothetical protein
VGITVRKREAQEVVLKIQRQFAGVVDIFTPEREFIRSGMLTKVGRSSGKREYIFHLFNDSLIYSDKSLRGFKFHRAFKVIPFTATVVLLLSTSTVGVFPRTKYSVSRDVPVQIFSQ